MKQSIITQATIKLNSLLQQYDGFNTVILDNWRGYRFIYDTCDVEQCSNDCQNCPLYQCLENETLGAFSAGLYPASLEDKKLFGPQHFLNCKTHKQYEQCYITFFNKRIITPTQYADELRLLRNMRILYAKCANPQYAERDFKEKVRRAINPPPSNEAQQ